MVDTEYGVRDFAPPTNEKPQPQQPQTENPFNSQQQVGHDGTTTKGMNREQWRDAWMGSGINSTQGAKDWFSQNGGTWMSDNGTVLSPFGETMDLVANARGSAAGGGQASAAWGGLGPSGPAAIPAGGQVPGGRVDGGRLEGGRLAGTPAPPAPPGASDGAGNPTVLQVGGDGDPFAASGGGVKLSNGAWVPKNHPLAQGGNGGRVDGGPLATPDGLPADNRSALMQLLRQRMGQDTNIDANNPVIKNQVDNFAATQGRLRNQQLGEAAEQASARGLADSGAMDTERRMANEQMGQATSGFQSELIGRELTSRRDEIRHALDTMAGQLTESERQALQRELAAADNSLKRYGIDTQNSQFNAGLSQSDKHFYDQLAQGDRLAGQDNDFRYAQLGQADTQFRDRLGFDTSDRQAYYDAVNRGVM